MAAAPPPRQAPRGQDAGEAGPPPAPPSGSPSEPLPGPLPDPPPAARAAPDPPPPYRRFAGGPPWARTGEPPPWAAGNRRAPWGQGGQRGPWASYAGRRRGSPGVLFLRFAGLFGLLALLLLGGLALLIFLVVRLAGGDRETAALLWLGTCGLLLALPLLAGALGRRAFRNIAAPLSHLLDASARVAAGDLQVRVPAGGRGEFAELSRAFNHMVEELALADRRRRNLTADVAHELRTPLQIIQGNLEGIADGVYAPTPEHIAATLAATGVLGRLVEDLGVLAQAEEGQLPLHWETIDAAELLADAATSFSGQAQAAGVALHVAAAAGGPLLIRGDYDRLAQVLGNLLANALRHTPPGGAITLSAAPAGEPPASPLAAPPLPASPLPASPLPASPLPASPLPASPLPASPLAASPLAASSLAASPLAASSPAAPPPAAPRAPGVRLRVADTGGGIAPADLPFVFDRFWRGDPARTAGSSRGLGLAIARELVQAHGGAISVQSTPGAGATFTIDLPAAP